jgi:hypothetical protein
MPNLYFVDAGSNFKTHGLLGPSRTTEELRRSIDIRSEQLIRERQLNTELRSSNDALSQQLTTAEQLNERLDRENKQWKGEVDKLKKNLGICERNLEATELLLKVSQQEAAARKRKCEECDAVCDVLRKERSDLESKNETLIRTKDMYLNELERRREENASLQQDLTVAKQIMEIQKDHKLNYEAKLTEIKRLEDKNRMLQNELKRLKDENKMLQNELEQRNEGNPF